MADEPMTVEFSSPTAEGAAFEQWEALMQQTYVPLSVDPYPEAPFFGRATSGVISAAADCHLTTLAGTNHEFRRSRRHIAESADEYLLAAVQVEGRARLHQDGRSALIRPGEMTFFDTSRPYRWTDGERFELVTVQVPIRVLRELPGLGQLPMPTAVTLPATGAAAVVASFFRDLGRIQLTAPSHADLLGRGALDLFGSAVLLAAGAPPVDAPGEALGRERVLVFLRDHCTDPELTIDDVARACHLSRRSLFRLFDRPGESLGGTLRALRVKHAKVLLAQDGTLATAAVALRSGFATERHFYRVFQQETGMTPGEFRDRG